MWLYEKVANALRDDENEIQIPAYITQNLSKELREYQQNALKHFLRQRKFRANKTNHLLFNMATGSGKTLMMASLMLECYKNGYRNFVFFVNSLSVLDKTRDNFLNTNSAKYLFKNRIQIDGKNVEINEIKELSQSKDECINILFTTIQSLYSLFKNEREGNISYDDLQGEKLVFLADEAHHLNADTKKKDEKELSEGWEGVIMKAFAQNSENLMLEFTATLPPFESVHKKYKDKVIYKYDLENFVNAGYAKRIFLIKYENMDFKARFLGAMILSLYRELLAMDSGIKSEFAFKPVILFKSESIKESLENENDFIQLVENIDDSAIQKFFAVPKDSEFFKEAFEFFKHKWGDEIFINLAKFLKQSFKKEYIVNTNNEKELDKNQMLLNDLENKTNVVRVIFSVDKLNEGWDVLNLFDIVRLNNKSASKAITTREAQLIGRGARYFPFTIDDDSLKFKRKFDSDIKNPLGILERITYHAINDSNFINELNKAVAEQGLLIENEKTIIKLKANKKVLENIKDEKIKYVEFKKTPLETNLLFAEDKERIKEKIKRLDIRLISNAISQKELLNETQKSDDKYQKNVDLSVIEKRYFLKAMNKLDISFKNLERFNVKSKDEFIENFVQKIAVNFDRKQKFDNDTKLEIAKLVLENIKDEMQVLERKYEVSFSFKELDMNNFKDKNVITSKKLDELQKENSQAGARYLQDLDFEWFYHTNALLDSKLEKEFLEFIESRKDEISQKFKSWFVIRNAGFSEFKIYDYRKNEPTYADGFEPDFVFFGKSNDGKIFSLECFMETKGEHLAVGQDVWKETLLENLDEFLSKKGKNNENFKALGLPFYKEKNDGKFTNELKELLK